MKNDKKVFVIMPFSKTSSKNESEWTDIFINLFKPTFEECGYSCERLVPDTGSLIKSIINKLNTSWIVLADITDRNANVMYELGVRHSLNNRTIIVCQNDDDAPSDLKGWWYIKYGIKPGEVKKFKKEIKDIINKINKNPYRIDSPVSEYLNILNKPVSFDKIAQLIENIDAKNKYCKLRKIYNDYSNLLYNTLSHISKKENKIEPMILYLCNNIEWFQSTLHDLCSDRVSIEREKTKKFWLEVVKSVKKSYYTTNVYNDLSYGRHIDSELLKSQKKLFLTVGESNFIRIFIFKDINEMKNEKISMDKQKKIGIDVRYTFFNKLKLTRIQRKKINEIGSYNITIIDNEYLFVTHIKKEKTTHIDWTGKGRHLSFAKELFDVFLEKSIKY